MPRRNVCVWLSRAAARMSPSLRRHGKCISYHQGSLRCCCVWLWKHRCRDAESKPIVNGRPAPARARAIGGAFMLAKFLARDSYQPAAKGVAISSSENVRPRLPASSSRYADARHHARQHRRKEYGLRASCAPLIIEACRARLSANRLDGEQEAMASHFTSGVAREQCAAVVYRGEANDRLIASGAGRCPFCPLHEMPVARSPLEIK